MNIKEIVENYLKEKEYTGLVNVDMDCGCEIDDIMPCDYCGSEIAECKAGYKVIITEENKEKYQNEINELEIEIGDWFISEDNEAKYEKN